MTKLCRLGPLARAVAMAGLAIAAGTASAAVTVAFENLPTNPSTQVSHHGVGGPVLADDFATAVSGSVRRIEWWGTRAASSMWELVFNTDSAGHPATDDPFSGGLIKYEGITATGVADTSDPALFHYSWDVTGPEYLFATAGTSYWLTVANFADGWGWSDAADGPTIGTEMFNAHRSTGVPGDPGACGDGGPHCGPWKDVHTDFAFRLSVPEPGSAALAGLALLITGFASAMRPRPRSADAAPLQA
jgi:hypothetical protein